MRKNVIVLLSGGLDSSTLAYFAANNTSPQIQNKIFTLTFDYGQRHKKELVSALKISKKVKAVEHKIVKFDLTIFGNSSLTDTSLKVPKGRKLLLTDINELTSKSIPNTYVPARNTIFLAFGLSFAEVINAEKIYIGVNSIDYSGYVDCRPDFIRKFQELAKVATVRGVNRKPISIETPLIRLSKSEIVKLGERLKVDWASTWSCYLGEKLACGLCDSCQLRLMGFSRAGVIDPLQYKQLPKFYKDWLCNWQSNNKCTAFT